MKRLPRHESKRIEEYWRCTFTVQYRLEPSDSEDAGSDYQPSRP